MTSATALPVTVAVIRTTLASTSSPTTFWPEPVEKLYILDVRGAEMIHYRNNTTTITN